MQKRKSFFKLLKAPSKQTPIERFLDRLDLACRYPGHLHVNYFRRLDLAICFPDISDNIINMPSMTFALDYYLGQPKPEEQIAICQMVTRQLSEPQEIPEVDIPLDFETPDGILINGDAADYKEFEKRIAKARLRAERERVDKLNVRATARHTYKSRMAEMVGSAAHMLRPSEDSPEFRNMIALCTGQFNEAGYFVDGASTSISVALASKDREQLAAIREITCPALHQIRKRYAGHKHLPGNTNNVLGKAFINS